MGSIPLYLLQFTGVQWYKEDNPVAGILMLVGIVGAGLLLLVLNLVKNGVGKTGLGKPGSNSKTPRRYSGAALQRAANSAGLDKEEKKFLGQMLKTEGVADVERVLNNPAVLDKLFKRAYVRIDRNAKAEEDLQEQLALLFSVRNTLESSLGSNADTGSTPRITDNMAAVLASGQDSYPVRVISVKGNSVTINCPQNALGTPVKFSKGAHVRLSFFTKSSKGFAYDCQIQESADSSRGPTLLLTYTGQAKSLVQRRFRRRQVGIPCSFSLVLLEERGSGRQKTVKMVVDKRRFTGSVLDVSQGGCSIRTNAGIKAGTRLKIELENVSSATVAVLGQILRLNRSGMNTIMHIKFLKVPRKAMNVINTIVFEYGD